MPTGHANRAQTIPLSHLGQNLCIWKVPKQQQPLGSTHLVPALRGIHVDVFVQVVPLLPLENLPGKGGGNPISLGSWVQEPPKCALPQDQPHVGLGMQGRADPTAFSSESSNLGRSSQLLTWGKGWVGTRPTPAPARPGVPPRLALTEKVHAIPTRQTNTRRLLIAAVSRNTKTHRGLAFQLESTSTTPNRPHVCVHMCEWGEEKLTSSLSC